MKLTKQEIKNLIDNCPIKMGELYVHKTTLGTYRIKDIIFGVGTLRSASLKISYYDVKDPLYIAFVRTQEDFLEEFDKK